jgi:hypothetical protein
MNKSEYYGPVGVQGTGIWNIATRDGAELRIHGQLSFTPGRHGADLLMTAVVLT